MHAQGPSIGLLGTPAGDGTLMWQMRKSPFWKGGDGNAEGSHLDPLPPSTRQRCWMSHQYTSHWIAIGYPMNKCIQ